MSAARSAAWSVKSSSNAGSDWSVKDLDHAQPGLFVRHRGAQQCHHGVVHFPALQEVLDDDRAEFFVGHRAQFGQAQIEIGGRREQLALVAVVPHDQRGVDARGAGDGPYGRLLVADTGEMLLSSLEDGRAGGVRSPRFRGHALSLGQRALTFAAPSRVARR